MKLNVVFDVESDGPAPGIYSMISLGAVVVESGFKKTFTAKYAPISNNYNPYILQKIIKITREEQLAYPNHKTFIEFVEWCNQVSGGGRIQAWSDNPAYDFMWIAYYSALLGVENPIGHSARRIGDLNAGVNLDVGDTSSWKKYRKTKHTHDPLDDAKGNAEGLLCLMSLVKGKRERL